MELLDGVEATAILEELHNTLGLFYRENYIQWSEMFPMNEFQNILEIAVRAGLRLYVRHKIEKYPATLQCVLSSGLQTTITIRQDSIFEVLSTSEVDISMLRLLLELGACASEPLKSGTKTTIWEHFLHERVRHHDMVPAQWHMAKFLPPDEQSSAPKVTTNAYDVCELVILHVKGNGLYFPGVKETFQQLFEPDQASRLCGYLEDDKDRFTHSETEYKRTYRSKGSPTWWNPLGYFS
jgi:hypothetical protein